MDIFLEWVWKIKQCTMLDSGFFKIKAVYVEIGKSLTRFCWKLFKKEKQILLFHIKMSKNMSCGIHKMSYFYKNYDKLWDRHNQLFSPLKSSNTNLSFNNIII